MCSWSLTISILDIDVSIAIRCRQPRSRCRLKLLRSPSSCTWNDFGNSKQIFIDWLIFGIYIFFVMSFSRSRYCMFLSFSAMASVVARRSTSTSNSTKYSISYASMDIFFVVKFLLRLVFCFFIFYLFNNAIKFGFFEWTRQMHYFRLHSWNRLRRLCSTCYMASLYTPVWNIKHCWRASFCCGEFE